ncbi:hypothetical protein D3C86_1158590 [compost metagenome]
MVLLRPASSWPLAWLFSDAAVTVRSRPALMVALLSMLPPTDMLKSRPAAMLPVWLSDPVYVKDRSCADCSVPRPCSAWMMTARRSPASTLPWLFFRTAACTVA